MPACRGRPRAAPAFATIQRNSYEHGYEWHFWTTRGVAVPSHAKGHFDVNCPVQPAQPAQLAHPTQL